jgi:hypothetical protein
MAICRQVCAECEATCIGCADACSNEEDVEPLRRCIRLNADCADICAATARLLSRAPGGDPKLLRALVEACARAAATCGGECERHASEHAHCRRCAAVCRDCAERCGRVLRDLPDSHGLTHPPAPATE